MAKRKRPNVAEFIRAKDGGEGKAGRRPAKSSGRVSEKDAGKAPSAHSGWVIGLLCLASVVVYGNSLGNGFVFDDNDIFVNRIEITSLSYIPRILGLTTGDPVYRPVRLASYTIDYFFSGRDPVAYHIFNILYHLLAGMFVYFIAFRITRKQGLAILASILFVVHPVQTDSVTYLSGRRDVLSGLFYLMGFHFFLRYRDEEKARYAGFVVLCYMAGIFSKEMAVTLPAVILSYDVLKRLEAPLSLHRFWRSSLESLRRFWSLYIILFLCAGGFTYFKTAVSNPSTMTIYHGGSVSANFLTVATILVHYMYLLVFPFKLNADYSYNAFPVATSLLDFRVLLSLGILAAVIFLLLRAVGKHRLPAFSGLWFFITLLPVCHIFPHHELLAEHYLYLPLFGFALFAATLVGKLMESYRRRKTWIYAGAALLLIVFSVRTIIRNGDWKDDITLWKKTVQTAPDSARARSNLGKALIAQGELAWAVGELKTALKIKPDFPEALSNLGVSYGAMEQYEEAIRCFEKAIAIHPHFSGAHYNLGLTLAKKGDMDGAASAFEKAVEGDPGMTSAHYNLGLIHRHRGDLDRAREHFSKAAGGRPDSPDAFPARKALEELEGKR